MKKPVQDERGMWEMQEVQKDDSIICRELLESNRYLLKKLGIAVKDKDANNLDLNQVLSPILDTLNGFAEEIEHANSELESANKAREQWSDELKLHQLEIHELEQKLCASGQQYDMLFEKHSYLYRAHMALLNAMGTDFGEPHCNEVPPF